MRSTLTLLLALALSVLTFVACDDSNNGSLEASLRASCELQEECDGEEFLYASVDDCVTSETPLFQNLRKPFANGVLDCYNGMTCTELENETCSADNRAACTSSTDSVFRATCGDMLECEEGELSFYDAERHCHLYTFHARFGEVRPYFYLGGSRGDGPPEPLRICPLRITVKEELDG